MTIFERKQHETEEMRNAYKFSIEKTEKKRQLGRPRCKWKD
jgi:hypothetical protein